MTVPELDEVAALDVAELVTDALVVLVELVVLLELVVLWALPRAAAPNIGRRLHSIDLIVGIAVDFK